MRYIFAFLCPLPAFAQEETPAQTPEAPAPLAEEPIQPAPEPEPTPEPEPEPTTAPPAIDAPEGLTPPVFPSVRSP